MAAAAVSMRGTYSKDSRWVEDARRRLEECKELLTRRGMLPEFNSPAYLPLHLHPLALIAETTDDPALRQLAIDLETRVWLDLLEERLSADIPCDLNPEVLYHNGEPVGRIEGDTSNIAMDAALRFIGKAVADKQPFLAVVWFPSHRLQSSD